MAISYAKVAKTKYIFRQLTGLTTEEFEKIVKGSTHQVHHQDSWLAKKVS